MLAVLSPSVETGQSPTESSAGTFFSSSTFPFLYSDTGPSTISAHATSSQNTGSASLFGDMVSHQKSLEIEHQTRMEAPPSYEASERDR